MNARTPGTRPAAANAANAAGCPHVLVDRMFSARPSRGGAPCRGFDMSQENVRQPVPEPAKSADKVPEKRAHHRVPCTGDGDLIVRVWRVPADDLVPKEPRPGTDAPTIPVDLSAGGLGFLLSATDHKRLRLDRGVPIAALVERKDARLIVHGEVRRAQPRADGMVRVGVNVELAEMSIERKRAIVKFEGVVATIRRIELETLARFGVPGAKQL